jgi:hypothetical protein
MTEFFGFLHHLVLKFSDFCVKLQVAGTQNNSVTLKMQAIRTSATPENITTTRCIHRQDDHHLSKMAGFYG